MELMKKALLETALAYYRLGKFAQYDSEPMTYQNRHTHGPSRLCSGAAPEMASADWTLYTVCSDFCYNVYKNCFGYELLGNPRDCLTFNMTTLPVTHPLVVVKGGREDGIQDKEEALKVIRKSLQVGDILVEYARALNGGPKGGHAMLFVGDILGDGHEYLMHSGGGKISMETGVDTVEENGTVRLDDCDAYCFTPGADTKHNCYLPWFDEFVILRPFRDPAFTNTLTASAESRLKYPGLSVDRFFDRHRYQGARPGETVTVTVAVKNTSEGDYEGLCIREALPEGASVPGGKAPCWTVNVPAGCEMKLSYKATVTAGHGETVRFPAGSVDNLPTREMALAVKEDIRHRRTCTQFANGFCMAAWGTDPGLPEDPAELITGLFDVVDVPDVKKTGDKMLAPKAYDAMTPRMQHIWDKLLPEHVGGRAVYLGSAEGTMACFNRVKVFDPAAYKAGDVFFCMESPSILKLGKPKRAIVYIYLGEGRVMTWDVDKGPVAASFEETLGKALRMNVILGLRP